MVQVDLVVDGDISAGEGGLVLVELGAEGFEGLAMLWGVGRVEGDLDAAVAEAHVARELGEVAEQCVGVVVVGVMDEETVEHPLLSLVGGELEAVEDGLLLELEGVAALGVVGGDMRGGQTERASEFGKPVLERIDGR